MASVQNQAKPENSSFRTARALRVHGQPPPSSGPTLCGGRPEAQRRPRVIDGDLPDRLDALDGESLDEPVAVEVGAELAPLGVADPGQAVGSGGADDRAEPVQVRAV